MTGRVMAPKGNYDPVMAPYSNYPCLGKGKWVSIAVRTEDEWQGLVQVMGNPSWTQGEDFISKFQRLRHRKALDAHIAAWTSSRTA